MRTRSKGERARQGQQVTQLNKKLAEAQSTFDQHQPVYEAARDAEDWQGEMFRALRATALPFIQKPGYLEGLEKSFDLMLRHRQLFVQQADLQKEYEDLKETHAAAMKAAEDDITEAKRIAQRRANVLASRQVRNPKKLGRPKKPESLTIIQDDGASLEDGGEEEDGASLAMEY